VLRLLYLPKLRNNYPAGKRILTSYAHKNSFFHYSFSHYFLPLYLNTWATYNGDYTCFCRHNEPWGYPKGKGLGKVKFNCRSQKQIEILEGTLYFYSWCKRKDECTGRSANWDLRLSDRCGVRILGSDMESSGSRSEEKVAWSIGRYLQKLCMERKKQYADYREVLGAKVGRRIWRVLSLLPAGGWKQNHLPVCEFLRSLLGTLPMLLIGWFY